MNYPTPLMLALSAAVMLIDPSVPPPNLPVESSLVSNADHWSAVASYAEAFPKALAKKVSAQVAPEEHEHDVVVFEGVGMRISSEAKDIRQSLVDDASS